MNQYIINTFVSETNTNYDYAISYYKQRVESFIELQKQTMQSQFEQAKSEIDDFDTILERVSAALQTSKDFFENKLSGIEIQEKLMQYNQSVQAIDECLTQGFDTLSFMEYLSGDGFTMQSSPVMPKVVDLSGQTTVMQRLASGKYEKSRSAGGARARVFGELMEKLVEGCFQNGMQDINVAIKNTARNLRKGKQVKSDITLEVQMDTSQLNTDQTKINTNVTADLSELVDISTAEGQSKLNENIKGNTIAGVSIKQWTEKALGTNSSSIAKSAETKNKVNNRYPEGLISKGFQSEDTFNAYTGWVVSKYLINVIGLNNLFIANPNGITKTYIWLEGLQGKYTIMHVADLSNSIWKAKNSLYVGLKT